MGVSVDPKPRREEEEERHQKRERDGVKVWEKWKRERVERKTHSKVWVRHPGPCEPLRFTTTWNMLKS